MPRRPPALPADLLPDDREQSERFLQTAQQSRAEGAARDFNRAIEAIVQAAATKNRSADS